MLDDAASLLDGNDLVALQARELRQGPARPNNFHEIDLEILSEAKVETRLMRRLVAQASFALVA